MSPRIGSLHFVNNYQRSLNRNYQQQAKLMEQGDGSSLHRASDNPQNYSKYLRYQVSESENTQYLENIKTAGSWMKQSDDVMIHMTEMMQTLKEKSVHAANSDNTEDDYLAIYKEMYAHMQEIVSVSNTQIGDRYLFAGQKDLTKPFEMSLETYDRGQPKNLDVSQAAFFKGTDSDYNTELFQMLTLTDGEGNNYYLDTENFNLYTQKFMDEGYKDVIAHGYMTIDAAMASTDSDIQTLLSRGTVATADTFKVADAFTNQGLLQKQSDVPASISGMFTYDTQDPPRVKGITIDGKEYLFKTVRQNIVTYNGDNNLISMVKLNGATDPNADTVNATGAGMFGRDIFDNANSGNKVSGTAMLNELFCLCAKVNDSDVHWMSSDGVTISDVAHSTMLVQETKIGARHQLFNNAEVMLERHADNITEDITNVSAADVAKLATDLMQQNTLYSMSLALGGRIIPLSLVDYLR